MWKVVVIVVSSSSHGEGSHIGEGRSQLITGALLKGTSAVL